MSPSFPWSSPVCLGASGLQSLLGAERPQATPGASPKSGVRVEGPGQDQSYKGAEELCASKRARGCAKSLQLCPAVWTSWTQASLSYQASLSVGFSRQECWSGLPCPPLGDLPDPGIEPVSLTSPALAGRFFTTSATWEAPLIFSFIWLGGYTWLNLMNSSVAQELCILTDDIICFSSEDSTQ